MRLMMGLSTLVIAAVALLWLALAPSDPPPRPAAAGEAAEPARSTTPEPSDRPARPRVIKPLPAARSEGRAADTPTAEPTRPRLVTPLARPVPRPIQAMPTPRALPSEPTPARVAIQGAVRSAKPLVAECYTQALAHTPDLAGTLRVSFTVVADAEGIGRIREAEVLDEGLRQPFLELCVLKALGTAEYPAPEGVDSALKVTYPFVLSPGD